MIYGSCTSVSSLTGRLMLRSLFVRDQVRSSRAEKILSFHEMINWRLFYIYFVFEKFWFNADVKCGIGLRVFKTKFSMQKLLHIFIFFYRNGTIPPPQTFVFQSTLHENQTLCVTRIILSVFHCMLFCAIKQSFLIDATYR